jgi:hypothetical protein
MDKLIVLKDVPAATVASLSENIRFHTVGFLRSTDARGAADPHLLGSGVLVSANGVRAILTAAHVLDTLPTTGRIGIFTQHGTAFETIDAGGVVAVRIQRSGNQVHGPDLGALVLSPPIAGTLAARKNFYNLDKRRADILEQPPDVDAGFWAAQGFLAEETTVDRQLGAIDMTVYNFTAVGGPDEVVRENEHDYVDFLVSYEARATTPVSWGGMSGGGLWQVTLREVAGAISDDRPVLAGILFYQHPTSDTTCGVKGHAWRSVYGAAYDLISNCR